MPTTRPRPQGDAWRRPYGNVVAAVCIGIIIAACGTGDRKDTPTWLPGTLDASGALLPDTQTVDGVLVLRHTDAALHLMPELILDSVPVRVINDGGGRTDLTSVDQFAVFSDGRTAVAGTMDRSGIRLFGSDGSFERELARRGEGPGDVAATFPPYSMLMVNDTVVAVDPANQRISWFTADGFVRSQPAEMISSGHCAIGAARLRLLDRWMFTCGDPMVNDRTSERPEQVLWIGQPGTATAVHRFPGRERRKRLKETTDGMRMVWDQLEFGLTGQSVAWDSLFVVGAQDRGFLLELRDTAGVLRREIVLEIPRQPVTAQRRKEVVDRMLAVAVRTGTHGGWRPGELERQAREQPFPDSLPHHGLMVRGDDGILWVFSPMYFEDTVWSAIGIRQDGAIVGRLSGPGNAAHRPFWFGRGEVLLRTTDEDGVISFPVLRIR